tara:strand:- start:2082 stop:2465 length:384 start_codon:yes stop_codon:yes gene_type:complete
MSDESDNIKKEEKPVFKPTKSNMLEALENSLGIVSIACRKVGISRQTHYRWQQEDLEYNKSSKDIIEATIDYVESKLFENIGSKKEASIMFYLKSKAKHRGYVERQEIDMNANNHFRVEIIDEGTSD